MVVPFLPPLLSNPFLHRRLKGQPSSSNPVKPLGLQGRVEEQPISLTFLSNRTAVLPFPFLFFVKERKGHQGTDSFDGWGLGDVFSTVSVFVRPRERIQITA